METKTEIWKDVPEWEGIYMVSDLGRVRKLSRPYLSDPFRKKRGKIIKLGVLAKGYKLATLCWRGKKQTNYVHRLVMLAFRGYSELTVDHINGIRGDNRLINLRYCTIRQNIHHAKPRLNCTSEFIGVYYDKKNNRYSSAIHFEGVRYKLGYFKNEVDAHNAYQNKYAKLTKPNTMTEIQLLIHHVKLLLPQLAGTQAGESQTVIEIYDVLSRMQKETDQVNDIIEHWRSQFKAPI